MCWSQRRLLLLIRNRDLEATFTACVDVPSAGFTDVPANHGNAGDIDCIAYYGITKGTSATTYSPLMSVSREHMALFLTRLAGKVGIEVTSTPDDAGFTDIGDLSENSQLAINQLADLGITSGTSTTTYSPGDSVRRDHMALFISKLTDLMTPIGGADSEWGHTPSDVGDSDQVDSDDVGTPYTDLGPTTKTAYDAITALYELGVVSGISDTAYAPSALITRASMAEFMAAVMDHSNLRPAGLSIQSSNPSGFGTLADGLEGDIVVSVRDDSFAPIEDQAVDHFNSDAANAGLKRGGMRWCCDCMTVRGTTPMTSPARTATSSLTVALLEATTACVLRVDRRRGRRRVRRRHGRIRQHVGRCQLKDEQALKATSTINKEATENQVDLDKVKSVTVTIQLVDDRPTARLRTT